jgi:hypothetical protein
MRSVFSSFGKGDEMTFRKLPLPLQQEGLCLSCRSNLFDSGGIDIAVHYYDTYNCILRWFLQWIRIDVGSTLYVNIDTTLDANNDLYPNNGLLHRLRRLPYRKTR